MSIKGFEQTDPLNEYELNTLLPVMIKGLKKRVGVSNAITSKEISSRCKAWGYDLKGARIRKLINHIRRNDLIMYLVASSKGYYIETNEKKLIEYIEGLEQRADAIKHISVCLRNQLNKKY